MLANFYMETKALAKTQHALEAIIKLEPKEFEHRKRLALFFTTNNDKGKAEATLREAMKDLPDDVTAKTTFIGYMVAERSQEAAIAELLPMIEQYPDKYDLRFMLVDLELAQKQSRKGRSFAKRGCRTGQARAAFHQGTQYVGKILCCHQPR